MKRQLPLIALATAAISLGALAASSADNPPTMANAQDQSTTQDQTTPPMDTTQQTPAQNKQISMRAKFDALDSNHDGYVDRTEAAADTKILAQFESLDTNRDGKLSRGEFARAKGLAENKGGNPSDQQE